MILFQSLPGGNVKTPDIPGGLYKKNSVYAMHRLKFQCDRFCYKTVEPLNPKIFNFETSWAISNLNSYLKRLFSQRRAMMQYCAWKGHIIEILVCS